MKQIILILTFFIGLVGFSQNPAKFKDGVNIEGIVKVDFDGISEDTAIDSLATWDGTQLKWVDYLNFLSKLDGDIDVSQSIKDLTDVYSSMTPTDGQGLVYDTTNGWQAETLAGSGDMLISVYDPNAVNDDAFDMDNMVEGSTTKILTDVERTAIIANTAKVTNATHTGDVTGATALTIADDVVGVNELADELKATVAMGALDVDFDSGTVFTKTLGANSTFTISDPVEGKTVTLVIDGAYTLALPASVKGDWEYDGASTNVIQIKCIDESTPVYVVGAIAY